MTQGGTTLYALDDAQREMSDFGEAIGSCLMCGRRDIGVIRDGAAAGTPTCTHADADGTAHARARCGSRGVSRARPRACQASKEGR